MPYINLRTLPTQTTAAFYLIVLVFMDILLGSVGGSSPICMWPVVVSLLVLPVRTVLATPRRELAAQDQEATAELHASGEYGRVQKAITELAAQVGHRRPIKLIISRHPTEARAFGSWRRHYILLGRTMVSKAAADLQSADKRPLAEAFLLHEIAHIIHKDVQRISYTRALFQSCVTVLPWWMLCLIGWLTLSLTAGPALLAFDIASIEGVDPMVRDVLAPLIELSPAMRADIAETVANTSPALLLSYLVNAFWPIIVIGFVLWLFYWRQMLRLQEYYADYLASSSVGGEVLLRAIGRYVTWFRPKEVPANKGWPATWHNWRRQWRNIWSLPLTRFNTLPAVRWFSFHPTYKERAISVQHPAELYENWKRVAYPAAVLTLALDVMLITPFFSYYIPGYPIHFSTLAVFLLFSTWLLPFAVRQESARKPLLKALALVIGVRWGWLLLNVSWLLTLALLAPQLLQDILNSTVIAMSGVVTPVPPPVGDPLLLALQILPGLFLLHLFQAVLLICLLVVYLRWQRRAANRLVNWARRHWWSILAIGVAATTLLLTPVTDLLNGQFALLWQPLRILTYALGLLSLAVLLLLNFWPRPVLGTPVPLIEGDD